MPQKIRLICIGKIKEPYLRAGIAEYEKRLRPYCKLEVIQLKDEDLQKEARAIEKTLGENTGAQNIFLLDAGGREHDSHQFARLVRSFETSSFPLTLVIGSAEGIEPSFKKKFSGRQLALSRMTFTHEMARLFLCEQLYRAFMLNSNKAYHK